MTDAVYSDSRLPVELLPEQFRRHVDPSSPPQVRMVAAQALVPMPPPHMVTALFMLCQDDDARIASIADRSLGDLPTEVLGPALRERLDIRVLDALAQRFLGSPELIEAIILNAAAADETIYFLTTKSKERQLEMIASNQVRLLRYPRIIEALYFNPNTRMSTVDRVIDFAVRSGVYVEGIPAFKEAAAALGLEVPDPGQEVEIPDDLEEPTAEDPPEVAAPTEVDAMFQSVLADSLAAGLETGSETLSDLEAEFGSGEVGAESADSGLSGYESSDVREKAEEETKRLSKTQQIGRMTVSQKVRLALLGTKGDRKLLLRDPTSMVYMAAIRSPKVNEGEAAGYAAQRNIHEDVIRYIANKRQWVKRYQMKLALVKNPKTPTQNALRFMVFLRPPDLKMVAADKNVPRVVSDTADAMVKKKGTKGGRGS